MKKLFTTCLFLFLGIIIALIAIVAYRVRTEVGTFEYETVKDYYISKFKGELLDSEKEAIKEAVSETRYKVYEEATEHNPEGDKQPDEIDDTIKAKIKEEIQ